MAQKESGKNGPLRSPMASTLAGKVQRPKVAVNTTMGNTAPKAAPIQSPNAPNVIKGRK